VKKVFPYGAIEIGTEATGTSNVKGSQLEHYIVDEPIDGNVTHNLLGAASS